MTAESQPIFRTLIESITASTLMFNPNAQTNMVISSLHVPMNVFANSPYPIPRMSELATMNRRAFARAKPPNVLARRACKLGGGVCLLTVLMMVTLASGVLASEMAMNGMALTAGAAVDAVPASPNALSFGGSIESVA